MFYSYINRKQVHYKNSISKLTILNCDRITIINNHTQINIKTLSYKNIVFKNMS